MSEQQHEPMIAVGRNRTDAMNGAKDDRLYNIGGARGLNLTSIPGLRNGLSLKKAGLFILIYLVWAAPLNLLGLGPESFDKIGYIIHFGPPALVLYLVFSKLKDSTITASQQLEFMAVRRVREHARYQGNAPAGFRGTRRIRFTMLTAPGATDLQAITDEANAGPDH